MRARQSDRASLSRTLCSRRPLEARTHVAGTSWRAAFKGTERDSYCYGAKLSTYIPATRRKTAEPNGPTKRYKVTVEEDHELGKFILQLRQASNTKVSLGLLNRVTNTLLHQALPEIIAEINNADPLYQPPNNDALAYAEFEESWARIIERALRRRRNPR